MPTKPLRIGGVLRCCAATLREAADVPDFNDAEGTVLPCRYCRSALWVRDDAWEWYRDYQRETTNG